MSLTQQFVLISIFPLSFLGMAAYLWRLGLKRRELLRWWILALAAAAVWAGSILRFYGGVTIPQTISFTWGVIGRYAFSATAVAILITTFNHLSVSRQYGRFALGLSGGLGLAALALDSAIWRYQIPNFSLVGQTIRHFDLFIAVWIASWLIPIVAAWILTQQINADLPNSIYRNQAHYWLLLLSLFMLGGGLTSIQQPGQPAWQEAGLLAVILAALTGTVSIAHTHLPDLQITLRRLLSRLSGTLIIFGLTWVALSVIVRGATQLPEGASPNLVLFIAAAIFAGVFTFIYRLVNDLTRRLFLPALARRKETLLSYNEAIGTLPEPTPLARQFLQIIQVELRTDDAWVFSAEDGSANYHLASDLTLRPLASLGERPIETISLTEGSLFLAHLRQNRGPLLQYDIDTLNSFDEMPDEEKRMLAGWERVLYMPLHAGGRLAGLLALGPKAMGESYDRQDFEQLQSLTSQISPLLVQAQHMINLRQESERAALQNQTLAYQKRQLREALNLHGQFAELISPELRQPFIAIRQHIEKIENSLAEDDRARQLTGDLSRQVEQLRATLERLISLSGSICLDDDFSFQPTNLDVVVQQAIRRLKTMAEARRVLVEYDSGAALPPVMGDAIQLEEAVRRLLHNAIKYNKIGGTVRLDFAVQDRQVALHVSDTGVGVPKERLSTLWQGLSHFNHADNGRNPGLGLTLTQYIIAAHGGHLEVESKYGSGSVFSVFLPVADER
ncbi:MAG: HAMP domain-containing histidine kinase [Chloroflexi bacterium]|nr:HAMP domain-containing histidine kinase [Chloroflexota bacterium]